MPNHLTPTSTGVSTATSIPNHLKPTAKPRPPNYYYDLYSTYTPKQLADEKKILSKLKNELKIYKPLPLTKSSIKPSITAYSLAKSKAGLKKTPVPLTQQEINSNTQEMKNRLKKTQHLSLPEYRAYIASH